MREVELKGVTPDPDHTRAALTAAGGTCVQRARMVDRRYDTVDGLLLGRDEVLRVRLVEDDTGLHARVDYKGAASYPDGFKVREEQGTGVNDPDVIERVFSALGLVVSREIERDIEVWDIGGATVRFEMYPRLDVLLEVEGDPDAIERAIAATGLDRAVFTAERLQAFIGRFEERTGTRAALSRRELNGDYSLSKADA